MSSELLRRSISGSVYAALWLLSTWQGGLPFMAALVFFSTVALREFYRMASRYGAISKEIGYLGLWAMCVVAYWSSSLRWSIYTVMLVPMAVAVKEILAQGRRTFVAYDMGLTLVGLVYCGLSLCSLWVLRLAPDGSTWVSFLLLVTWGCDVFAYLVGRYLGRHPLAPAISPRKSWEGLVGGCLGSLAVSAAFALSLDKPILPILGMAFLLALWGQLGDLAESLMKRQVGLKDSGSLMPGHGGVMDRLDSLLFNAPLFLLLVDLLS